MKTKEQIADLFFKTLSVKMSSPNLAEFNSDAHIIDDLAIESSVLLELLMHMELDYDLVIPEESLMDSDFETVRDLVQIMYTAQGIAKVEKGLEVYEDLKVHCVASCLSEIVKRIDTLDHRILYFGVWDSEIFVNDNFVLSYHDKKVNHKFFTDWYEKLYGMKVTSWYDKSASKESNVDILINLVEGREPDQHIMVMLDMFKLPERENEFNKDPFPHYVMLGPTTDPELWFMYDPDYRWEGIIKKSRILNSVNQASVSGGYLFSDKEAKPAANTITDEYFRQCFVLKSNPVTDAVREVVSGHLSGKDRNGNPLDRSALTKALEELPVIAPRKYAYEHGFAFFWRELLLPEAEFEHWCEEIDKLCKTYKLINFTAMKYAASGLAQHADKLNSLLNQQDETEFGIKQALKSAYEQWHEKFISEHSFINKVEVPA